MPSTTSKNLGLVAAVITGATAPSNTNVIWLDTSGTQTIKRIYDPIALQWIPLTQAATVTGDNWGTQVVVTDATLDGEGVNADPLKIAQQGAASGQVLTWNGGTWVPQTPSTGGLTSVAVDSSLQGNGTPGQPIGLNPQGASDGQILRWNQAANKWLPSNENANNGFTPGMILEWSGTIPKIPAGWQLCNGEGATTTGIPVPDMRGLFIVGYSDVDGDYNVIGNEGGAKTVSLTSDQNGAHSHTVNDPGHFHNYTLGNDTGGSSFSANWAKLDSNSNVRQTATAKTNISIVQSGSGQPHENRPPYYVLAYIIKL